MLIDRLEFGFEIEDEDVSSSEPVQGFVTPWLSVEEDALMFWVTLRTCYPTVVFSYCHQV